MALQQLQQMPDAFLELLRTAAPQCLTPEFHTMDYPGRYLDLLEMCCGSGRLASLCSKVTGLFF